MITFLRYLGYMTAKWLIFYIWTFGICENNWEWSRVKSIEDIYYTIVMLLLFPFIEIVILALPMYLTIHQKRWSMAMFLALFFILEFTLGWYSTNQHFSSWMFEKIILSIILFYIFFKKQIKLQFRKDNG